MMLYGNQEHDMTQNKFPDKCIQSLCSDWWVKTDKPQKKIWHLGEALVRHTPEEPYVLEREGRSPTQSDNHSIARFRLTTLKNANSSSEITNLPIAAVPHYPGELLAIHRAKRRPVLIIATTGTPVEQEMRQGSSRAKFAPVYLVAPYYSAGGEGIREGFKIEFLDRVRALNYTQFFWDFLPHERGHSSVLRLDHIQPVEPCASNLKPFPWMLSEEAQEVVKEAIILHLCHNKPKDDGIWATARKVLSDYPLSS